MLKFGLFVNLCESREIKTRSIDDVVLHETSTPNTTYLFGPLPLLFGDAIFQSKSFFVSQSVLFSQKLQSNFLSSHIAQLVEEGRGDLNIK